ncbi:MAG TPA: hypothetical protein VJZ71_16540 [Phycisphaerae bacterium]|nr:hypothetical protein [Phycisphaerae bacterium]
MAFTIVPDKPWSEIEPLLPRQWHKPKSGRPPSLPASGEYSGSV